MEDKKTLIKLYSFTYGKGVYIIILCLAAVFFIVGAFLMPKLEGIATIACGLFFVLFSLCLIHFKYLNYVTMTDESISTKKQTYSWKDVYITMSFYNIHKTSRRTDYYIFFDDHYLSKDEIYSRRVKKNAFYIMVTQKRLDLILQKYNKRIQLLDRCAMDKKSLYEKVCEYNEAVLIKQSNS